MPYKDKERQREYDRERNLLPARREAKAGYERKRRSEGKTSYTHEWYLANKERLIKTQKVRYAEKRLFIDSFKKIPCMDCGKTYPPYVMDFDHVTGEKLFSVSRAMGSGASGKEASKQKLLDEIAKCELVCANCHRERTHAKTYYETYKILESK